jgi:hypothetical protein
LKKKGLGGRALNPHKMEQDAMVERRDSFVDKKGDAVIFHTEITRNGRICHRCQARFGLGKGYICVMLCAVELAIGVLLNAH